MLTFLNIKNFLDSNIFITFAHENNKDINFIIYMEKFNINKIMSQYGLQEQEVANLLWPMVKYPELGFKRVLRGETYLDSAQICALAHYLQVPVSDLFTVEDTDWHAITKDKRTIFTKGKYKVIIGRDLFSVSIYDGTDNFYNSTASIGFMEVSRFLNRIDEIIREHEQDLLNK